MNVTAAQKRLIEKLGVFFEGQGRTPAEARIIGLLLVADQLEMTLEEIQHTLGISKSAVNNAINVLMLTQQLEYVTKPGDRKKYYKSKIEQWMSHVEEHVEKALEGRILLKEALDQRSKSTKEFNTAMKDMIEFMEFVQSHHQEMFAKWKKSKGRS
ncbi:MAG: MarR family transcriptional regulator [Cytophagaceae bacterium]|nr:MarR family transcriptional regulator [Cytophagaceae bacterium]